MIGGKWTTFRAFAEQMCERLSQDLGFEIKSNSRQQAIGGGKEYPTTPEQQQRWIARYSNEFNVPAARATQLLARYGTNAQLLGEYIKLQNSDSTLQSCSDYSVAEINYLIEHEQVEALLDIVLRRTNIAISGLLHMNLLIELNCLLSEFKHWSEQRAASELNLALAHLEKFHGLSKECLIQRSVKNGNMQSISNQPQQTVNA